MTLPWKKDNLFSVIKVNGASLYADYYQDVVEGRKLPLVFKVEEEDDL